MSEQITITKAFYDKLIDSQRMLSALNAVNVKEWDRYKQALKYLSEMKASMEEDYGKLRM